MKYLPRRHESVNGEVEKEGKFSEGGMASEKRCSLTTRFQTRSPSSPSTPDPKSHLPHQYLPPDPPSRNHMAMKIV